MTFGCCFDFIFPNFQVCIDEILNVAGTNDLLRKLRESGVGYNINDPSLSFRLEPAAGVSPYTYLHPHPQFTYLYYSSTIVIQFLGIYVYAGVITRQLLSTRGIETLLKL